MVLVSYSGREINAKLVYYGPGLSGKTTNLEAIYGAIPETHRGKMVSMKTKTERTLFFDFLPVQLGELSGFNTRFLLYTVPGQIYYNATRKLVLKGVDAVVFVADSKRGKMDENIESLQNLKENLREHGLDLDRIPWVIQYNKRDLPDVYSIEELERALNPQKVPSFEAAARTGLGVLDTFKAISRMLLSHLSQGIGVGVTPVKKSGPPDQNRVKAPPAVMQAQAPAPTASIPSPKPIPIVRLAEGAAGVADPVTPAWEKTIPLRAPAVAAPEDPVAPVHPSPSPRVEPQEQRTDPIWIEPQEAETGPRELSFGPRAGRTGGLWRKWFARGREAEATSFGDEALVPDEAIQVDAAPVRLPEPAREVPIFVDLEPEDLDRGLVLKLKIRIRRQSGQSSEDEEPRRSARAA